ncbi:hypothetical protein AVEN_228512-1 [Araneus ventricosus]|uniref:Uncharacterized protein n=1 Tax=Araneus ventricosus TaxID=182803 RepID=A0A4Y2D9N2_ARAVE|nr:hypothetical protein AVEN_228512-1 [Araneus ventricosus]
MAYLNRLAEKWNGVECHHPICMEQSAPECPALDEEIGEVRDRVDWICVARSGGNQSIGQYLSVHKDSFSNPPTNGHLEEAVVVDWPKMMKFKAS